MDSASPVADLYIYAYPLLLMDVTRQQTTCVAAPEALRAPRGQFAHARAFPDDTFASVVGPNVDTLDSSAFLDLGNGPVVLSVPNAHGRYYLMPIFDAWSNVIASPGARTTGTEPKDFAVVGPGWAGELPDELARLDSPTRHVWIFGHIQTNGSGDAPFVHALQDQFKLTSLSSWGSAHSRPAMVLVDPNADSVTAPTDQVERMTAEIFWTRFAELLKWNPPAKEDAPVVARLAVSGVVPGQSLDWAALSAEQRALLTQATADGLVEVEKLGRTPPLEIENTWAIAYRLGTYGTQYKLRASAARMGLGANLPQDAIAAFGRVDHGGNPLKGKHAYVMHFDRDEVPPVHAFWSLTMYDERQVFARNPIDRFAIGDRDPLAYDEDGSLNLYIQYEHPGLDREANWLPAPAGLFCLILRLYWPDRQILDGTWVPPRVTRIG